MVWETTAELTELTKWARRRSSASRWDVAEVELLLELLSAQLDIDDPADLEPEDVEELLLGAYPATVIVEREEELDDVIPAMRGLLDFLGDTARIPAARLAELRRSVDRIEPRFADTVMSYDGLDDEELVDLKEALDLPDRLPPLRLPDEAELAATARGAELIGQAARLAGWVGERPRGLQNAELTAGDAASAARALGLDLMMEEASDSAFPGMPTRPKLRRMTDLPRLVLLWTLAEALEFIEADDRSATIAPGVSDWQDGSDDDVLDIWEHALAEVLNRALPSVAETGHPWDAARSAVGPMLLIMLFLARGEGLPIAEIRDIVKESATQGLGPTTAERAWRSWTTRHGDPTEHFLTALTELGAIRVDGETARLTPLSMYATRLQLLDAGVDVPLLPSSAEMTAADLIEFGRVAAEDELDAEWAQWVRQRNPETAVDELLAVAADGRPEDRMSGASLALRLVDVAEQRWRRALDQPTLRPYAKLALAQVAGAEAREATPGLEPTLPDLAWLVTDTVAATADAMEPDDLAEQLATALPPGQERAIFEQIWRLDHPSAHEVLITIGRHHPDKAVAKAARTSAYKIRPS